MTKADLIEEVSRVVEMTRKESEVIVEAIFDSIVRSLRTGDKIEIRGFGSFRTRQRQPRIGRNPKTGARVEVPAKKIPYFKPSKELKDVVNNSATSGSRARPGAAGARAGPEPLTWTISGLPGDIITSQRQNQSVVVCSVTPPQATDDRENLIVHRGGAQFRHPEPLPLHQRPRDGGAVRSHRCAGGIAGRDAGGDDPAGPAGGETSASDLPSGRAESGDEPGSQRGRGDRGARPHAHAAALDGRHQFHDGDRRDARPAGRSAGDVGEAEEGFLGRLILTFDIECRYDV